MVNSTLEDPSTAEAPVQQEVVPELTEKEKKEAGEDYTQLKNMFEEAYALVQSEGGSAEEIADQIAKKYESSLTLSDHVTRHLARYSGASENDSALLKKALIQRLQEEQAFDTVDIPKPPTSEEAKPSITKFTEEKVAEAQDFDELGIAAPPTSEEAKPSVTQFAEDKRTEYLNKQAQQLEEVHKGFMRTVEDTEVPKDLDIDLQNFVMALREGVPRTDEGTHKDLDQMIELINSKGLTEKKTEWDQETRLKLVNIAQKLADHPQAKGQKLLETLGIASGKPIASEIPKSFMDDAEDVKTFMDDSRETETFIEADIREDRESREKKIEAAKSTSSYLNSTMDSIRDSIKDPENAKTEIYEYINSLDEQTLYALAGQLDAMHDELKKTEVIKSDIKSLKTKEERQEYIKQVAFKYFQDRHRRENT